MTEKSKISINEKLDLIINNQKTILENESKILKKEGTIEELEKEELKEGKKDSLALKELEVLEKKLSDNLSNPVKKVTKRDLAKGFIGASVGVISHFAFTKAAVIAVDLSITRTLSLYFVAFIIIVTMLYYTGFRTVHKKIIAKFLPLRATVLYLVSIITIIGINFLFGKIYYPFDFLEIFKLVGASIILAVMGAGTADLIGRNE